MSRDKKIVPVRKQVEGSGRITSPEKHPRAVRVEDLVVGKKYLFVQGENRREIIIEGWGGVPGRREIFFMFETNERERALFRWGATHSDRRFASDSGAEPYRNDVGWNQHNRFEEIS